MSETYSYDIHLLGLTDASKAGRIRFAGNMERLTGKPADHFSGEFPPSSRAIFEALDAEQAKKMADSLYNAGVLIDIRVSDAPPADVDFTEDDSVRRCPACKHAVSPAAEECDRCGVVFAKYEREQLLQMQKDHTLEQAMIKAMQVREEWLHRAMQSLEQKPLKKEATAEFANLLIPEEVPFLRLNSAEGPLLLTSRRMVTIRETKFESIPYEMIKDVDYGGGRITTKKAKFRLQVIFHTSFPMANGELAKNMSWHLDKDSSFNKDVVIDWGYARNFICGSCGERELDYRTDVKKVHMRCMHCATDHEIDLAECVAVPLIKEA